MVKILNFPKNITYRAFKDNIFVGSTKYSLGALATDAKVKTLVSDYEQVIADVDLIGFGAADGFQEAVLQYPELPREAIFEAVDRFYRGYFLRPRPILRILKTMLEDQDVFVRRCREGCEFFKTLNQRRS